MQFLYTAISIAFFILTITFFGQARYGLCFFAGLWMFMFIVESIMYGISDDSEEDS